MIGHDIRTPRRRPTRTISRLILRKAEALDSGRVVAARVVHAFPTVLSHFHRLKLDYEGGAEGAPRHLYLKTGLPDSPGAAMDSGRREVAFYTDVAPTTPPGLLPRCFDAQAADGAAWHLLLEDLTDTHFIATQWPLPPTVTETEAIMRCRARFQAAWWDHPRLGDGVGAPPVGQRVRPMAGMAGQATKDSPTRSAIDCRRSGERCTRSCSPTAHDWCSASATGAT